MKPEALVRTVEDFLVSARDAVVMEEGVIAFDLAHAKYSVSGEHNKCLLHLWSAERNLVRRDHFLWRMHPERWLESHVVNQLGRLDTRPNRVANLARET